MPLLRQLDLPPLWTLLFIALAWMQVQILPGWTVQHPLLDLAGGLLVGAGFLLMALGVMEMRRHKTTFIPHQQPDALVTTAVFARSRNPIYLGDCAVLLGLILYWGGWPGLILIPLFMWVITDRFIAPEEARLRDAFGPAFDQWAQKTRRWL